MFCVSDVRTEKKKESDDDQLSTKSPACQITAAINDKPLSKLKF